MAGLHFDVTGDNSNFMRKLRETEQGVRDTSKQIERSGMSIEDMFGRMTKAASAFGAGFTAKELVSNIVKVRGEFQQLEVAFNTMLGSKEKADALMAQMVKTAATTPFDLQSVAGGAKQLLAYGVAAEDINQTLIRLGDIAAGLSVPLGDLVYLYGTTRSQGRLYTEDFNQFTGRGIPMIAELAKQFGVAESEVKGLVEAGKIGFPEVQKVIESLTNEGGKFGGLMEAQSKTISGQISNIGDSISMMFNEIGQANEGVINGVLGVASSLVENYEQVGKVLIGLVSTYGAYKTATIAVWVVEQARAKTLWNSITATKALTVAQASLNKVVNAHPFVLVTTAVIGLAAAVWSLHDSTLAAEKAQKRYNEELEGQKEIQKEHKENINGLITAIQNENEAEGERLMAFEKLKAEYPQIFDKYTTELDFLKDIARYKKLIAEEDSRRTNTTDREQLEKEEARLKRYQELKDYGIKNIDTRFSYIGKDTPAVGQGKNYTDIDEAIKAQMEIVNKAKAKVADYVTTSYLDGIKELKDEDISSTLEDITHSLQALGKSGNDALAIVASLGGEFSKEQLTIIKSALETEQKSKNGTTYQQDLAAAKADWEKAKKGYEALVKDQNATSKQVKDAKSKMDIAENRYKTLTGNSMSKDIGRKNKIGDSQAELQSVQSKNARDISRQLENLYLESEQACIDALEEGGKKTLEQMELNHEKELLAIDREKEDLIRTRTEAAKAEFEAEEDAKVAKNPNYEKRTFDPSGITLSDQENALFDNKYKAALDRLAKERQAYFDSEKQAMNEYLAEYGNYEKKRLAITELYNEKIKKALASGNMVEALKSAFERNGRLSSLESEKETSIAAIEKVFGNLSGLSGKAIDSLIAEMEKYKKAAIESFDIADIEKYEEALSKLQDAKINNKFGALANFIPEYYKERLRLQEEINAAEETSTALSQKKLELEKDVNRLQKSILSYIKGQTGQDFSADDLGNDSGIGNIMSLFAGKGIDTSGLSSMLGGLVNLKSSLAGVSAASGQASSKLSGLMSAFGGSGGSASSVAIIDTIVNGINNTVQGIATATDDLKSTMDALGKDTDIDTGIGKLSAGMNMFAEASQGAANAWNGLKSGDAGAVISGVTQSITAWIRGFAAIHDAKNEKQIQKLQDQIDTLDRSYDKLGRSIEKAYSTDASELIEDQNKLLEQQKVLIQQQIAEEQDKKKSDDGRIKEWQQQIEDINNIIEDNKEKVVDAIFGEDLKSAIKNFSDAYAEAWANGKDRAKSAKDTVKKMMQQMVTESIKAAIQSSKSMEQIRKKLQEFYADNVLTGWEQDYIYNMAEQLQKGLDDQFGWAEDLFKDDTSSGQQSASGRGFGTEMTHEDAGELSGRFTALYEVGLQILQTITRLQAISVSVDSCNVVLIEIKNLMISSNSHLEDISGYVKRIVNEFGNKLDNISNNTKGLS